MQIASIGQACGDSSRLPVLLGFSKYFSSLIKNSAGGRRRRRGEGVVVVVVVVVTCVFCSRRLQRI
jgi:hypothetical protein